MAEEKPIIHIDNDWKRQAQEEKKRLVAEEARKVPTAAPVPAAAPMPPAAAMPAGVAAAEASGEPVAAESSSFVTLVQSLMTQTLYYLGDISSRSGQPMLDFDRAKLQIDMLGMLEEKTTGNLNDREKLALDSVLYNLRNRYVNIAMQYL